MKKTLTVETLNGSKATRKTDKDYKFAVVGLTAAYTWSTRRDLAEKKLAEIDKYWDLEVKAQIKEVY